MDYKLHYGDALDIMGRLVRKGVKVDAIITDPPYGTTACKWDSIIPFNNYLEVTVRNKTKILYEDEAILHLLKNKIAEDYIDACYIFDEQCKHGMWYYCNKLSDLFIFNASQPFLSTLVMSNTQNFKHEWIWIKNRGSNFANTIREPMKEHESILIFANKKWTYNKQLQERTGGGKDLIGAIQKDKGGKTSNYGNFVGKDICLKELRVPASWQKFNCEVGFHPTQKPVALMEYLIKTYTYEGDTVLDFTCGSGSTGVACRNLNRNFIGIDNGICEKEGQFKDWKWVDVAKWRIENEK